jgi:hypothetical protein
VADSLRFQKKSGFDERETCKSVDGKQTTVEEQTHCMGFHSKEVYKHWIKSLSWDMRVKR